MNNQFIFDELQNVISSIQNIHGEIVRSMFPDGAYGTCKLCGRRAYYSVDEICAFIKKGWDRCEYCRGLMTFEPRESVTKPPSSGSTERSVVITPDE